MATPIKTTCRCGGKLKLFKTTKKEQTYSCEKCKKVWIIPIEEKGFLMTW